MEKCYIIIVDTLNNNTFNSKRVKNVLYDALLTNATSFNNMNSFLERSVEFIEFDKNCDNILLEHALLKEHLFVNIISSTTTKLKNEIDIFDFDKSHKEANHLSFHYRHFIHLKHAFTSRNKNALYIIVNDVDEVTSDAGFVYNWTEINWFGFKTQICRDQIVLIDSSHTYELEMKRWLLSRLISIEGNFSFYSIPILSKMISGFCGLVDMDESTLYLDKCASDRQDYYLLLSSIELSTKDSDFNRPVLLHASCNVDWHTVKSAVYSLFKNDSNYVGHFRCRLHPLCQDVNFLLVSLLRFFKVLPQNNQLPFTTTQMATLVSDCLHTGSGLSTSRKYIFFIEDLDWIASSTVPGQACSWLPEKCAANVYVIMTAANDSLQQKSLKARVSPPIFIDVSFTECVQTEVPKKCLCSQRWCVSRLLRSKEILEQVLSLADNKGIGDEVIRILSMFHCSFLSSMSGSLIQFLMSSISESSLDLPYESCLEKDNVEVTEKSYMHVTKSRVRWPVSDLIEKALVYLVQCRILSRTSGKMSSESSYSLASVQLRGHLAVLVQGRVKALELESLRCHIGAYFVYQSTDLGQQMTFVPAHLQYLGPIKDAVIIDWLLDWVVLMKFTDEYSVPVKLLLLWRAVLGPDTDYSPMLNAYIRTCLAQTRYCSQSRSSFSECPSCRSLLPVTDSQAFAEGPVCLDALLQPTLDLSKKATRQRCRVLLELSRLAMHVGQYAVAKDMARVLLKLLDQSVSDRSLWTIPGPDKALLASCLHLLFCTLDERLKTFEFVTEQTTPIFRRTVHYGARALLLQDTIVDQLQRTLTRHRSYGSGDGHAVDMDKLQRKLCLAEVRLARIMTHFVFSLDGVEQTAINRHFLPSKIRTVTNVCMTRAHEIAIRLRDRSLLLEIQMTFGVIQPRENYKEKILLYKTPLRQALAMYGQCHVFVSRIYINIGISYEEQKRYLKAYEYFSLWSHITHELLGRRHCKSVRSCGVFLEPIFKATAEFINNLNGERPSDSLEEELKSVIGQSEEEDGPDGGGGDLDLSVEGVRLGAREEAGTTATVSLENMFALRTSLEQDTDWEIHSSDDETPNYTTAFEEVIDKFQKMASNSSDSGLLHSLLEPTLIDSEDLTKDDIAFLLKSQETANHRLSDLNTDSQNYEGTVLEAIRITRLFRGLQDFSQIFPTQSSSTASVTGSSLDLNLASRLLELQRDLQDFLYN